MQRIQRTMAAARMYLEADGTVKRHRPSCRRKERERGFPDWPVPVSSDPTIKAVFVFRTAYFFAPQRQY